MGRVLRRRLVQTLPVAFISTILAFLVVRLAPGDPAQTLAGPDATPAVINAIRVQLGLNKPLYSQYISWLGGLFQGNLGHSYLSSQPVTQLLPARMVATGELILAAAVIAIVAGIALGSVAAYRRGRIADAAISWLTGIMVATPEFWVGLLLILLFAVRLGWLPVSGRYGLLHNPANGIRSLLLPACTLSFQPTALIARTVRASVVETLSEDFIRTAQAKGISPMRLYLKHVLPNSLIPILAIIGLAVTRMLGGSIVVESVFAWPGVGLLLVSSISSRDYQVVQDSLLLYVLAVIVINIIIDLAYSISDPRVRANVSSS